MAGEKFNSGSEDFPEHLTAARDELLAEVAVREAAGVNDDMDYMLRQVANDPEALSAFLQARDRMNESVE